MAGLFWTQMADMGPAPRSQFAMAFDSGRNRSVVFGGISAAQGGGGTRSLGDTWEWDGDAWTQLSETGPSPRHGHAMAFDAAHGLTVLFGGLAGDAGAAALVHDTWVWDGNEWTQREDVGPSPRTAHSMAYDSGRQRTVLFGGDQGGGEALGDTWEWDGQHWTKESDFGANPGISTAMAFKGDTVALFGGISSLADGGNPSLSGNTWTWNGTLWTERQDIGPRPRWLHATAFDGDRLRLVLFGGTAAAAIADLGNQSLVLGDTWELPGQAQAITLVSLDAQLGPPRAVLVRLSGPAPAAGVNVTIDINPADTLEGAGGVFNVPPGQTFAPTQLNDAYTGTVTATLGGVTKMVTFGP